MVGGLHPTLKKGWYTELLQRRERSITPRDLRRAIDYMEANLAAPITVADIAEASGIAGRTLFQYFRDFRATSPMRYLRDARFEKALSKALVLDTGAQRGVWKIHVKGEYAAGVESRIGLLPIARYF